MIHEILLSLWKYPEKFNDREGFIEYINATGFLHPGDYETIQLIMDIALKYHRLQAFIELVSNRLNDAESEIKPGLYMKAFADGLDDALECYREQVLHIEDQVLKNPNLQLGIVLAGMKKFDVPLTELELLIDTIKKKQLHGCNIMGMIINYIDQVIGVFAITEALEKVIQAINKVFYQQLCNWIIYGELRDEYNEFFIKDCKEPDENYLFPEEKKSRMKKPAIVHKFALQPDLLPDNIPAHIAEIILFIGRMVWVMRNDPKVDRDRTHFLKPKASVWEGKEIEYYKTLQALENHHFDVMEFEKTIGSCRAQLTKFLWKVITEEANLLEHLQMVRDYYCLGRGELFQRFLTEGEQYFKQKPNNRTIITLNYLFNEIARKIYTENDKTYLRFELMQSTKDVVGKASYSSINLEMNFEIHWPLHIVFHPKALELYNRLFSFLLRLKKTGSDLHRLWVTEMDAKFKIDHRVWTLRYNLIFIVGNLQYYMQVDVIEAQFSILINAVKAANEFEDIIRLHTIFLTNLLSQSFLLEAREQTERVTYKHQMYQIPALDYNETSVIFRLILKILEISEKFCSIATTWEARLTEPDLHELDILQKQSDNIIEALLQQLYDVNENSAGRHVLQLLQQLDYNNWFTKRNGFKHAINY